MHQAELKNHWVEHCEDFHWPSTCEDGNSTMKALEVTSIRRGSGDVLVWVICPPRNFRILLVFQDLWVGGFGEPKKNVKQVTKDITYILSMKAIPNNHLGCRNKRINYLSTGAGFFPATVSPKRSLWIMNCQGFQAFSWGGSRLPI